MVLPVQRSDPDNLAKEWHAFRDHCAIFEDDNMLALSKPAGISVVGGNASGDIISMASNAGEKLHPVHRIDKVTSGLILFTRDAAMHAHLTRQFNDRSVTKTYLGVTQSVGLPELGTISLPLSVGRKKRVRIAAKREDIIDDLESGLWSVKDSDVFSGKVYPSTTRFAKVWEDEERSLLVIRPVTGRRHQIRVHLAWIGHPIAGDPLFLASAAPQRALLHSWKLAFDRGGGADRRTELEAPPDDLFWSEVSLKQDEIDELLGRAVARLDEA